MTSQRHQDLIEYLPAYGVNALLQATAVVHIKFHIHRSLKCSNMLSERHDVTERIRDRISLLHRTRMF